MKYFSYIMISLFCGIGFGLAIYRSLFYCVDFHIPHHPFYGKYMQNLKIGLENMGYMTQCSAFFPRVGIYTYNTTDKFYMPKITPARKNIVLLGDCDQNIDTFYLRKYDGVLTVNEYTNGYISTFNIKTTYFPVNFSNNSTYCLKNYDLAEDEISCAVKYLDTIIQGLLHD